MSPGWQSKALQIASKVENRIALALPFLSMEMLAIVIPTFSVSSVTLIFLLANITSIFMIIAIIFSKNSKLKHQITNRPRLLNSNVQIHLLKIEILNLFGI
jgi:hypothetical protein